MSENGKPSAKPGDAPARRDRVLTKKMPAIGRGVATAFVIKDRDVFLVTNQSGNVPLKGPHGFGLYYHDCRFLDGYLLKIDGRDPIALVSTAADGFKGVFELTNPELPRPGGRTLDQHEIAVRWDRLIEGEKRALHEVLRVRNFSTEAVDLTLTFSFRADFEDVYAVRDLCQERRGALDPARWEGDQLRLRYQGADAITRATEIRFWRHPDRAEGRRARFLLHLEPDAEEEIALSITLVESRRGEAQPAEIMHPPDPAGIERRQRALHARRVAGSTQVHTDHVPLHEVLLRSLSDLAMLRTELQDEAFYSAGVPWFVALFGRDSILVALETLAYDPEIAGQTLRLLARYQGKVDDPSRDEEPGKILHELRVGELAHLGVIPHTPYYGSVDATPLFLVLMARHAAWTGRMDLFHELRPSVDAALAWMSRHGESRTTGYLEYRSRATGGLGNQGWKDSGDAIVMANGDLARQPIALVEVQGYAYLAKTSIAALFQRAGEAEPAARLRREAEALKQRFTRDYWLADRGFFALALTPDGPAAVLSSNPGQALWSGIVGPDEARRTMESLLAEPMFSGWGIRTLSKNERRYNPVAYHRGTVWPHDNALIAAGFRRCGFDDAACQVFEGIVAASMHFPMRRLPELFAGFRRADYGVPVRYPVACHPQAWAAASVPFMLERLLGLSPDAFARRLRVVRPTLPASVGSLELRGLRVGSATVDLAFQRQNDGRAAVRVLRSEGQLDVDVDPEGTDLA
jgi:glycogen debranching enzyme